MIDFDIEQNTKNRTLCGTPELSERVWSEIADPVVGHFGYFDDPLQVTEFSVSDCYYVSTLNTKWGPMYYSMHYRFIPVSFWHAYRQPFFTFSCSKKMNIIY